MNKLAKTCFIAAVAAGAALPTMAKSAVAAPKSEKKACAAAKSDLDANSAKIVQRMKAMQLPEISFAPPQTISDAIEFFVAASRKHDSAKLPKEERGFSFVLSKDMGGNDDGTMECNADQAHKDEVDDLSEKWPTLPVINAKNISFYDALKLTCDSVGYKFTVRESILFVMSKESYAQMLKSEAEKSEAEKEEEKEPELDAKSAETVRRMKAILLPEMSFKPSQTISDAIQFFVAASKKYDSAEIPEDKRGVSFALRLDNKEGNLPAIPPGLSTNIKNIPLYDALQLVCQVSGYTFKVCDSIVIVVPVQMKESEEKAECKKCKH